uniref:Uncharacterized protein n=1 Tax=Romanomermis culicivorax TaxID=13658 RepID=A0A915JFL9_ROMCU
MNQGFRLILVKIHTALLDEKEFELPNLRDFYNFFTKVYVYEEYEKFTIYISSSFHDTAKLCIEYT